MIKIFTDDNGMGQMREIDHFLHDAYINPVCQKCLKEAAEIEKIKRLIEDFENNPKYYIHLPQSLIVEWDGIRVVNGEGLLSGAKKLIKDIKDVIETISS